MTYDSMTLLDLKKLCKNRGLKVSGSKDEVIIRLMENDELNNAPAQTVTYSTPIANMPGHMPVAPQVIYGRINSGGIALPKRNDTITSVGSVIIIYGIFRMFWALVFAAASPSGLGWVLAPIAFIVAAMFIFGGILMTNEFKNGVFFVFVTFLISGTLSIIFTGNEINPLSISLDGGGSLIPLSIMCTLLGIGIAGLPLLFSDNDLKEGWPPAIERILNRNSSEKNEISCPQCGNGLLVPSGYSGKILCPKCNQKSDI